ncbi:MAG: ABC transporter ATP-binding protein [Candidatus Woesearchaeota archaeon]|nr:ABC transporter ATP-binding protein [Candidatus Woesearchaeota archaeon]
MKENTQSLEKKSVFAPLRDTLEISWAVVKLVWECSPAYTIQTVFFLLLSALIPIGQAFLIKRVVDLLTLSLNSEVLFSSIIISIILYFVLVLIDRFNESRKNINRILLGNLFQKHINRKIVDKTSRISFWKFESPMFHDVMDRIRNQAPWRPLNVFYSLFDTFQNTLVFVSMSITLYVLSPLLVVLMLLCVIPNLAVQVKYGSSWWNILNKQTPKSRHVSYLQSLMSGYSEMKDIKLLSLREHLLNKYGKLYAQLFSEQKVIVLKRYWSAFFASIASDFVLVGFYVLLAWRVFSKVLSIGDFSFFSMVYLRSAYALQLIVHSTSGVYEHSLFVQELLSFLNTAEEQEESGNKKILLLKKGFEFEDVWFKYPESNTWILKGVSFSLPLKQCIALVGENGAGKTTIVKLLLRLYKPTKGRILLDGVSIEEYDLIQYRHLFGVAFQDFARFCFSAEENIKIGDVSKIISSAKMVSVAKRMQIHDKILSLPSGYKSKLGRWLGGTELSHGEWQRLAIARALVRDVPVYVLDEPTASLDARAEYTVFQEFAEQVKGKSALFISHRFSNVKLADHILFLEHGQIIEQGNHAQLTTKKGKYWRLYTFQAKRYQE